jgi:hypothetical protein
VTVSTITIRRRPMRALRALVTMTVMVAMSVGRVDAQQKPNFSGRWTLALNNAAFACGDECTIVQTATTLSITRPPNPQGVAAPVVVLYLDGRENTNMDAGRAGGAPREYVSRVRWDGATLVTTRSLDPQGRFATIRTLALDGDTLTIVTTTSSPGSTPQVSRYTRRPTSKREGRAPGVLQAGDNVIGRADDASVTSRFEQPR